MTSEVKVYTFTQLGAAMAANGKSSAVRVVKESAHLKAMKAKDAEIKKLQSDIRCMVKKAADKNLEGYRELGQKCAAKDATIQKMDKEIKLLQSQVESLLETNSLNRQGKMTPFQDFAK